VAAVFNRQAFLFVMYLALRLKIVGTNARFFGLIWKVEIIPKGNYLILQSVNQ